MPDIQSIRQQYPQYGDMSDDQLASALHQKFYADMPESEFRSKIGLNAAPQEKPKASLVDRAENAISKTPLGYAVKGAAAVGEVGLQAATGFGAQAVAGLKGVADIATGQGLDKAVEDIDAAKDYTYEPKTEAGKAASKVVQAPFQALAQGADIAGQKTAEVTGSPAAGAAVNTAIQAAPLALGARAGAAGRAEDAAATTAARGAAKKAEAHVNSVGLDWNNLAQKTKDTITKIAESSKDLSGLDPKAIERVDRANKANLPISRGQATRNLSQLTDEENISRSTSSGAPVRDINTQQDIGLHGKLDTLRQQTGGKAETRSQLGESVQGAERAKLRSLTADYRAKYRKAQQSGELKSPVDSTPLYDWLNVPANERNAGYLKSALEDYQKDESGSITVNDLEQVRKEANVKVGSSDKTEAYYAKQAVKVIDDILDNSGGDAYKAARKAFGATREEFDRQGLVSALTKEKGRTTDRAVALEDTFDTVVRRGSNEQLQGLLKSLTSGGSAKTKALGAQAVKDLQAATIDYLKEKAAGKRGITGEQEQLQFNSTFIDAVDELDKDGKLNTLFGPQATASLRELRTLTRDLRTKPADRIAGPNTTPRIVALLDKIQHIPGAHVIGGAVKLAKKVTELGKEEREAKEAATNPLESAASSASRTTRAAERKRHTLRDLKEVGSAVPVTLGNANQ